MSQYGISVCLVTLWSVMRCCVVLTDMLDIPVYKNKIHSLHVLFTLYMEFKNSQVHMLVVQAHEMIMFWCLYFQLKIL